jgi:flagellar biosynthesis protein FlhG
LTSLQSSDQAEGLRRLLGKQIPKVITLVSGGARVGKTCAAINLAAAMAQAGRSVMLLDENCGPRNVTATLGIDTVADMADTVCGIRALEQTLVPGPEGLVILPAGRGVQALSGIDEGGRDRLVEGFARVGGALDFILVDTAAGASSRLLPLSHPEQQTILIANASATGQANALGMIKLMHRELGARNLHLLVSMTHSDAEGEATYYNLANVADRHLGAGLEFFGVVPADERIAQAGQVGRAAVEMFPHAPSSLQWRRQAREIMQWPLPREAAQGMERFVQRLILGSRVQVGTAALSAA